MAQAEEYRQYDPYIDQLKGWLKELIAQHGSDLHIKSAGRLAYRVNGDIRVFGTEIIPRENVMSIARGIMRTRFDEFIKNKEIDLTFKLDDNYRFRVNFFFQKDGPSAVFRVIPTTIKSLSELSLPIAINKLSEMERGLVLVTGVTGSGKSTTLAALINEINMNYPKHIITIEDPLEFVHQDKMCLLNQRTIGEDTLSFSNALRSALREDPDIILVGEMRDLETVEIALHAAETGHLVFSTLHTMDAKETVNRIIGMFSPHEQNRIRIALAAVLQGIVSQRLVKTVEGGRVAAVEILLRTPRIVDLIKQNRDDEIRDALAEGKEIYGTQTFDQALLDLYKTDIINEEEALKNATSPDDMRLKMRGIGGTSEDETQVKKPKELEALGLKI